MEKPWLKHYDDGVPVSIDYPQIPLGEMLKQTVNKYPHRPVLIFGAMAGSRLMDKGMTYRELDMLVDRFAASLQALGIKKGDRVAIMLPNSPQFIISAYAIWRIGAVAVFVNPIYVARELRHILQDSGCETIIVMSSLYHIVKSVRDESNLRQVIVVKIKQYFPWLLKQLFTLAKEKKEGHRISIADEQNTFWFEDVLQRGSPTPKAEEVSPQDVSTLIYTGGTTGFPKGAQLTHHNLVSNAVAINAWGHVQEAEQVILAALPFFHIYGLTAGVNTPIYTANTIVVIPNPRDLHHILASIQEHKATYFPGVPTMFIALNNLPEREKYDLTSLRFAVCAAAPLPPEVQDKFQRITGCKMIEAYGLTETSPAVIMDPVDSPRPHSIGVPLPDIDARIVDLETGEREMPVGESGEIIVKGPAVMKGYWNMPTETANVIRQGPDGEPGWFHTGDIGTMDEDGYFHIVDRKKDMIIAGGFNIYPAEVESVLYDHPKVLEAAVIGVPDERRGESVKAFVVPREGEQVSEEEIIDFCRQNLAAYKVPRQVEFRQELPKSLVGKILRRELRQEM
jgi:long-chain acyl-CoA synthetase